MSTENSVRKLVDDELSQAGIQPVSVQVRTFPGEVIAIIEVDRDYELALKVASLLDEKIENGFVTVRLVKSAPPKRASGKQVKNVHDERVASLMRLLTERSRTSESQPSLRYIQDVGERLSLAVSPRHHLVFGRRGVGKTALLLEAKRVLEAEGVHVLWVNMQPLRSLSAVHAFLTVALRICDLLLGLYDASADKSHGSDIVKSLRANLEQMFLATVSRPEDIARAVPLLQQVCSRFCVGTRRSIYIFLDDVHYLSSVDVPRFLDYIHGVTRDNPVWLKVAGIQHQTRWFVPDPPMGLQNGHDATIINLDVTLERPEKAKAFLESVLRGYIEECDAMPLGSVISASALDRLVLASGGVPRDFLTLCAASIQTATARSNAQTVGVQDVNNAAGIAGQTKLQELEDDAAATSGRSAVLVETINRLQHFLLSEQKITFFRVDFRDKERHPVEYRALQALADLRLLHLINNSLSDQHQAGQRSEVYLLDLSQYSGYRLKQGLFVLDFERGHMVLKRTRSTEPVRAGDSVLKLVSLLRRAPILELARLTSEEVSATDVEI